MIKIWTGAAGNNDLDNPLNWKQATPGEQLMPSVKLIAIEPDLPTASQRPIDYVKPLDVIKHDSMPVRDGFDGPVIGTAFNFQYEEHGTLRGSISIPNEAVRNAFLNVVDRNSVNLSEKIISDRDRTYSIKMKKDPAPPDNWIKCSERLPDDLDEVLVFHPNLYPNVFSARFYNSDLLPGVWDIIVGKWFERDDEKIPGITHWQPLPEPPRE